MRYFSSPGSLRMAMYSPYDDLAAGFPHSDIRGSKLTRSSPRLFAACHVLHRLLAPRHPPNALLTLDQHRIRTNTASPHRTKGQYKPLTHALMRRCFISSREHTNPVRCVSSRTRLRMSRSSPHSPCQSSKRGIETTQSRAKTPSPPDPSAPLWHNIGAAVLPSRHHTGGPGKI